MQTMRKNPVAVRLLRFVRSEVLRNSMTKKRTKKERKWLAREKTGKERWKKTKNCLLLTTMKTHFQPKIVVRLELEKTAVVVVERKAQERLMLTRKVAGKRRKK